MNPELRARFNKPIKTNCGVVIPNIPPQKFSELRRIHDDDNLPNILHNINHNAPPEGRSYNCANCALAFEMIKRGYNVKARPVPDGTNVGNIDEYIIGSKLFHFPYVMSNDLMRSYRVADNYRRRYWAMKRKHRRANKNWRVNKKLRAALNHYFDVLDNECDELLDTVTNFMIDSGHFGTRGIMILGIMQEINPTEPPQIYHAINYEIVSGNVRFHDMQNHSHFDEENPFRYANPHNVYIMRTNDKKVSPQITECVYSE